jgi:acid phosphatase class B
MSSVAGAERAVDEALTAVGVVARVARAARAARAKAARVLAGVAARAMGRELAVLLAAVGTIEQYLLIATWHL